ncbi:MAG: enoyl-CoA hydratase [Pseudomonadota bacterium]|nr:enoyl-CoA hydratase [Pseudomonadota bacterium]
MKNTTLDQSATPSSVVLRQDNDNGVTYLTLNRPAQYNALSEGLLAALEDELTAIAADGNIRVVVLAGAGAAFCAGHDLKEMRQTPDTGYYESLFKKCTRVMMSMVTLPQPVIAKVHGTATAAGCQLVANADLAIASNAASFAVSGINLGLFCSTPGVALSRNVPRKRSFELLMTGRFIDADTAVAYGLINRAVSPATLDQTVSDLAADIASKPEAAVRLGKKLFYQQLGQSLDAAYALAGEQMAHNMGFDETIEGIDAFIEKRSPDWT